MAKYNAEGIDGLMLSLAEFAAIPDDIVEDMLQAGADVVIEEQKRVLKAMGIYDTKKLHDSVMGFHKARVKGGEKYRYVLVYPYGVRGYRNRKLQHKYGYGYKFRANRHYTVGGDTKAVTNNEVGFIHEFGAPKRGIPAKQWMKKANINAEEAMLQAELEVYDRFLKSKDL